MPIHFSPDRRRLLQLAGASATTLWLPRSAWSQTRVTANPFALGVASGSPLHDSVVLWTRLVSPGGGLFSAGNQSVTLRWEVADDDQFSRLVQHGQVQAPAALGFSAHVEVQGLAPDRWYHYRFMLGDAVSAVGRTRTLPAPDAQVDRLRVAYASCQRYDHGYYSAWRHLRADQPDLVLFLGDYIYESAPATEPVREVTGGVAMDLAGYRQRYALYKSDPDLQAMHAACPWIVTWDDHEVQNDYAGLTPGRGGPEVADFAARRAAAYQAFYEHMPLRASVLTGAMASLATGGEMRIYAQQRVGRLASIMMLDARQYRDRQACTGGGRTGAAALDPAGCPEWNDPARTLLGRTQEAWLDGQLAKHKDTQWQVLGQQYLFGLRDNRPGPGQYLWNDSWDGYPAARTRLTDSFRRHAVANPVLLGGDIHENWVGHVKADYAVPDSPTLGVEFCGTSITSRSGGRMDRVPQLLAENPHLVFGDNERKGYGLVDFTPTRMTTRLRVVDDVTRADAGVSTLAQFAVAAGRPVIERI